MTEADISVEPAKPHQLDSRTDERLRPDRSEVREQPKENQKTDDHARDGESEEKSPPPDRLAFFKRHPKATIVGVVIILLAAVAILLWWLDVRHYETTDDAFIDSRPFSISPKVAGYIVDVSVTDNQHVEAGAPLFRIDDRDYKIALEQSQAQVAGAEAALHGIDAQIAGQQAQVQEAQSQVEQTQAALKFAEQENARASELAQRGAGTVQQAQQTVSALRQQQATLARTQQQVDAARQQLLALQAQRASSQASLTQAQASRDQANLNLSYTEIKAAQPGHIVHLSAAIGAYAQIGQNFSMFVPDTIWVTANYKESQITDMRPGQPVQLRIDAYPGRTINGHIESIQPGSGTAFSLLPAENATGNYVKVVQRIPVKIVFDQVPADITLGPGMSVVPWAKVR